MKTGIKKLAAAMAVAAATSFSSSALTITPTSGVLNTTRYEFDNTGGGGAIGNAELHVLIAPIIGTATLMYKSDVGGSDSGPLAGSYDTDFTPNTDPEDALIEYTGSGDIVAGTIWLLIKDGNSHPDAYLFNLTALGWDGQEDLLAENFWVGQGAISHVELLSTTHRPPQEIPDGGATAALLGLGLLGVTALRRKK